MNRTRLIAIALAVAVALAGCGGSKPAAAPSPTSSIAAAPAPSPSPSSVDDGAACDAVVAVANEFEFNPATNQANGRLAAAASDRGIALAGQALVDAANGAIAEPGPDANLDIAEAQLAVAEACADAFGRDGPWSTR